MRDVLVKVQESQGSSRTRASWSSAGTRTAFVVTFSYVGVVAGIPIHDDQGTYDRPHYLTMKFDPAKIDHALVDLRRWSTQIDKNMENQVFSRLFRIPSEMQKLPIVIGKKKYCSAGLRLVRHA
ncbi:MAG: hypothetical protein JOY76_11165 [Hyphomicrobiales bacterium]|nr:hypothetical protein [Hyphomicrobiales bacterium]